MAARQLGTPIGNTSGLVSGTGESWRDHPCCLHFYARCLPFSFVLKSFTELPLSNSLHDLSPAYFPFFMGFTQHCSSLTGLSSSPSMYQFFCTLETPVFTMCSTRSFLLPHPPTAKISTNVTSSQAFFAHMVTLITTFCLSAFGINKSTHPCPASLNVCNSRGEKKCSVCYRPFPKLACLQVDQPCSKSASSWIFIYFQSSFLTSEVLNWAQCWWEPKTTSQTPLDEGEWLWEFRL